MTRRAILLGLAAAAFICGITYFNTSVMRQTRLVGNFLPISVYGSLVLFVVLLNPALRRVRASWRLEAGELAVILTLVLAACGIAESGLLRGFTNVLILPHLHEKAYPSWRHEEVFERVPKRMLADPGENNEALSGFVQGRIGTGPMSFGEVPWSAWGGAFAAWLPLILLLVIAFIGLALVVHRQWAEHEHLPYPLAGFASSLLGGGEQGGAPVLAQRAFWIAAGAVFALHVLNFAHGWWPRYLVSIPTRFDFRPVLELLPSFENGRIAWSLFQLRLYFAVIGFAYLVSSEVSLSFGLGPYVYTFAEGLLLVYGISLNEGGQLRPSASSSLNAGSYVGLAIMVLYCGRFYYWSVVRRAAFLRVAVEPEPHVVWGCRAFLTCSVAATVLLVAYGLPWPFAALYMLGVVVMYVAVSRIVAETGLFFMKPLWGPHILVLGLFGMRALGPTAGLMVALCSAILFAEPREMVMPYVVNSFKLLDGKRVRLGRAAGWAAAAVALGLFVGIVMTLYFQYDRGTDLTDRWTTSTVPRHPFTLAIDMKQRLRRQGLLDEADSMSSWRRLFSARPDRTFAVSFLIGVALVVGTYVGRLRVRGWPIHPAVFLVWSWGPGALFAFSFLVGWFIKTSVLRYGGWQMVQRLKPVMFGLIAGEMLGGVVPAIISSIYYFATGEPPAPYSFMP